MTFLAPIAGLIAGAIGAGLVLLMYMLKLRRRPVLVSSTLLWKRAVKDLEGNIPWQRLSPTMLLLLHLLIVALLALAIARPVMDTDLADGQRVALVIDTTASMGAEVGGESLLAIAKRNASDRVRALFDSGRSPRVTLIEAGLEPRIIVRDSGERGRLLASIDALTVRDQPGSLIEAMEIIERLDVVADETAASGETLVWVFSDGGGIEQEAVAVTGASGVLVPSVGEGTTLRNLGIVALSAQRDRVDTELCRVFVRVRRSTVSVNAGILRLYEDDGVIDSAPLAFESDQMTRTHSFEIRLVRGALLRVELAGEDALRSDNRAWVSVPPPDPVRVTIMAPGARADPLLSDSVEVVARAPARVIAPGDSLGDPDLMIYDRVDADGLVGVPSIGFGSVLEPFSSRLERPTGNRRVLSWDRDGQLFTHTGIGAMTYRRSITFEESGPGFKGLARDQDGTLIAEFSDRGNRHLRAAFVLHDSNWGVQVGFTVFMAKVIEYLLPGVGGQGEVYRTDTPVAYIDAEGIERAVAPTGSIGRITLPDAREVGVSLLSDAESALATRDTLRIGETGTARRGASLGRVRLDLWRWFVGGAIALLLIEWLLYLRKVRVSL